MLFGRYRTITVKMLFCASFTLRVSFEFCSSFLRVDDLPPFVSSYSIAMIRISEKIIFCQPFACGSIFFF